MHISKVYFCLGQLICFLKTVQTVQIGFIVNASLFGGTSMHVIQNETCNKCICDMIISSFVSFNCFSTNKICQVFANYSSLENYTLLPASNTVFYFRVLPQILTTTENSLTTLPTTTQTPPTTSGAITTTTISTTTTTTITTTVCATKATSCTSCNAPCTSGVLMSLSQINASRWVGTPGNYPTIGGFTNYSYTWIAPDTSSIIRFAFQTTTNNLYWDLDNVSIKNSSNVEQLINGNFEFQNKTGWNETCQTCSLIQRFGPLGSYNYWVGCQTSPAYQFLSQKFTSSPCMRYTISFQIALYYSGSGPASTYVYMN